MRCRRFDAPLAVLAALLGVTQTSSPVDAAPRQGEVVARQHFRRGEDLYAHEQYAYALIEFEEGYAAFPLPGFLINIGQCRRRLGDMGEARAAYERFLKQAPDSPLAPSVRELIRELVLTPPPLEATKLGLASPPPVTVVDEPRPERAAVAVSPLAALGATHVESIGQPAVNLDLRTAGDPARSNTPPTVGSRRLWWIIGSVALTAVAVTALSIAGSSATTSTTVIHDGTLGTLRR